ncbi:MAG: porin family protein [Elusimicrobia bacterium]|nr:porin family protein [Elusimicrobiota bacterium]
MSGFFETGRLRIRFTSLLAAALAILIVDPLFADSGLSTSRGGATLGGRGMYFRAKDADTGTWSGGAQLRFHLSRVLGLEGSIDYRQSRFAGTMVDVYPVQASILVYLLPDLPLTPYLLGGGGWYYTQLRGHDAQHRFGPHAGAGLELFLNNHWSIDGSYRYVWLSDIHSQNSSHPLGTNLRDSGHMVTAALNWRF